MYDKVTLTPDAERRLIKAIEEGVPQSSLRERFGVSQTYVTELIRKKGLKRGEPWFLNIRKAVR